MNVLFFLKPKAVIAYIYEHNTVRQGLEKMRRNGYTAIPVIDKDGAYVGTVTEGDFLWRMVDEAAFVQRSQEKLYVRDIIKQKQAYKNPVNINAPISDLLVMVTNQNYVPVVDDLGTFIGIVTRRDVMNHYFNKYKNVILNEE